MSAKNPDASLAVTLCGISLKTPVLAVPSELAEPRLF